MPDDGMKEIIGKLNLPFDPDAHIETMLEGVEGSNTLEVKIVSIAAIISEITQKYSDDAVMAAKNWARVIQSSDATSESVKATTSALLGQLRRT